MHIKLDQTDLLLLQTLQANAKVTNLQLAEYAGLSPASTLERVRKLEKQGFIQSYHAKLDNFKLNLQLHLWLQIRLHSLTTADVKLFKEAIAHLPEVISCYQVIGNADFLLQVVASNMAAYQALLTQQLSNISGIREIETYMCLETMKETGLPINHINT
jgi:Lrp/AsnC family leucine-responsive transcriptional regulator